MSLAARCISIDLEVSRASGRIHALAAVRGDDERGFVRRVRTGTDLAEALTQLDAFAAGAGFVLGHNLVAFDLPHLMAAQPGLGLLGLLGLPALDTLRLNPLAFPKNPYHRLVKHYKDGAIERLRRNDPELDARLALALLGQQERALAARAAQEPDLVAAWHGLLGGEAPGDAGVEAFFAVVRAAPRPGAQAMRGHLAAFLAGRGCAVQARSLLDAAPDERWPLAYATAWLSVAGGNSVMPPWVNHEFPQAGALVRRLRDRACADPGCGWCRARHDAASELRRWFRLDAFRPEPQGADGRPLQQAIVEAALRGEALLGILPTGTGKSLCYQLPALSRYDKTGALSVVISPLVALMADQVAGLEARGIGSAAALNGLLSMPERADVLERLRLGDIAIVLVSPEQLRSTGFRRALAARDIGAWVLDEAHCLSKWGHDFRPDYRYVARFIRERAGAGPLPALLCLTATAKPDVVADIVGYFEAQLGVRLRVFDGGAARHNLDFAVVPTDAAAKFEHVHQLLAAELPDERPGGAIVYGSSQVRTEKLAQFLRDKGWAAEHFHAGVPATTKKERQRRFVAGELRVIVATNAFGMGIDKPDVRLVVHADVPGSLENYLQEAGRAGRDRQAARCVLLYADDDVERQFRMSARSRLTQREIDAILRTLRHIDRRKRLDGEVVVTAGEVLLEERDGEFKRDSATDDTRVRTAIAWLEEAKLLSREENAVHVFPSSLRVGSRAEAEERLRGLGVPEAERRALLAIVETLLRADADEGVSTDDLMGASRLGPEGVRAALFRLQDAGLASNDLALTAFVHHGVERASMKRFEQAVALETALLDALREHAPDLEPGEVSTLQLRHATQRLKDAGLVQALPELLWRSLRSLAEDGRGEDGGRQSLELRRLDAESVQVRLQRHWPAIAATAALRREAASRLLEHLLAQLPAGQRGTDLLVATTLGRLMQALTDDLALRARVRQPHRLLDHALLWLHEQEVIRLNKGLAVFRPAMTIRLRNEPRGFGRSDFAPLELHYHELVLQIHVMAEYAQRGLAAMADALRLTVDYFSRSREEFMQRWLPGRDRELARQTTPASWRAIVEALDNPAQQRIVADDRERTNVLVLAGPGAGKTRVLVHRIAYLVRVRREDPGGIVALAYNRHAAVQIRRRLGDLVGEDARAITVLTCHALAMRLVGASFAGAREAAPAEAWFEQVLREAAELLEGRGLPPEEADAQRARLLAGFRWILIDEYQDIGPGEYRLVAALAGRTLKEADARLGLFAVGDDDQNLYAFKGASVGTIRRFEADYAAKAAFLVENYRSTAHIIDAANRLIAPARERLKAGHAIAVDRARRREPAGGAWARLDPLARGRVQWLAEADDPRAQAVIALDELRRLAALDPGWDWSRVGVIARQWQTLEPVRACAEALGIAVQMADESLPPLMRLRETRVLLDWLRAREAPLVAAAEIAQWLAARAPNPWWARLGEALGEYALETGGAELPLGHFVEALADWGREQRRRQTGLLLLTAHRAKGLEFDHVVVLDGHWERVGSGEDPEAPRRAYYVAMTRARRTLALARLRGGPRWLADVPAGEGVLVREALAPPLVPEAARRRRRRLAPGEVELSWAGRRPATHAVHLRLAALRVGDALGLRRGGSGRWDLLDAAGEVVGRLASGFAVDAGFECVAASVAALVVWRRADSDEAYRQSLRCDAWEVVLPELVLAPVPC